MKRILSLLIFVICFQVSVRAQDSLDTTHPVIVAIQAMDFSQYVGLPVDSLIARLPSGFTELKITPSIVLKRAAFLEVKYAPSTSVYIAVRKFDHMNPEFVDTSTPTQNWDINLFKKEKMSFAIAFNGDCFNGCENSYKFN